MRAYRLRYGVKRDGPGSNIDLSRELLIDALSDEDAIELAKDSEWIANSGAANLVQLLDDEGLVIWQKAIKPGARDDIS
jgi:hypothetical protein